MNKDRMSVLIAMMDQGVIPVFYHPDVEVCKKVIQACANGAKFVVGPILNADVAKVCNRRCIPYSPGCGSASEISYAHELGCELVKVFPGSSVGGPEFVKNVLGPMPWTRIMPTGGVEPTEESLRKWYGAGIVACGIGSNLITKELLAKADYAGIEARVRDTVKLIKMIRGK